jgi:diacylglycerol kinase family enzyme
VFFPAAPFFLFMHGKDITIPKGTEITAYINGDMRLDLAKFQPATQAAVATVPPPVTPSGRLKLETDPPGADIEIDGNFVGNTPSEIEVAEGEHTVTVKKAGFKDWERKLRVTGGSNVNLSAKLEKQDSQPSPDAAPK